MEKRRLKSWNKRTTCLIQVISNSNMEEKRNFEKILGLDFSNMYNKYKFSSILIAKLVEQAGGFKIKMNILYVTFENIS